MTTPIFFSFFWYAFVLAKRSKNQIDALHNNFFEKITNFTSKNLCNLIFNFFFLIDLVTMEGLF
jgi:hypothetical protein